MTTDSEFSRNFNEQCRQLEPLGPVLAWLLQELLNAEDIRSHSVTWRIKTETSTLHKLGRLEAAGADLSDVGDLLGVRVITHFPDEVDAVARVVEREFAWDEKRSVDKRALLDPDRFGYLSVHYTARLLPARSALVEYRRFADLDFEIQIRSILQHAWAEIEHDLGYKSAEAIPRAVRRRFSRLAGTLELADNEFVAIRDELTDYSAAVAERVEDTPGDVLIDQDSIRHFAATDKAVRNLDAEIAQLFGATKIEEFPPGLYGKHAAALSALGFTTLAELRAALDRDRDRILAFAKKWITKRFDRTSQGISLYYETLTLGAARGDADLLSRVVGTYEVVPPDETDRAVKAVLATADQLGWVAASDA